MIQVTKTITKNCIKNTEKVVADNGIEIDEVSTVLLDTELYPED